MSKMSNLLLSDMFFHAPDAPDPDGGAYDAPQTP